MAKTFKGRPVVPGTVSAEALVPIRDSNAGELSKALMFKDKDAKCSDQNNPDIYEKPMHGGALCLPQTIGSTTGGMVLYCAAALGQQPACLLFSQPTDSLAAAGAILADVWTAARMTGVDGLGDEFLASVKTGAKVEVKEDGTVIVD
jgi:predicted aconitase with swiveling domain